MSVYARVKPQNVRLGFEVVNVHFNGTLFRGGARPTWYKVTQEVASKLQDAVQTTGAAMFDVVTEEEKARIDQQEQAIFMASLGMLTPTAAQMPKSNAVDLTVVPVTPSQATRVAYAADAPVALPAPGTTLPPPPASPSAREMAIPDASGDGFEEITPEGGDLTTADIRPASRSRK